MKVESVQISNILSFEFSKDINRVNPIVFGKNLNILIGPNGAGKSNFLEVLNQSFQNTLFKRCTFNESVVESYAANPQTNLTQTLVLQPVSYNYLPKNKWSKSNVKTIKLVLNLNEYDIQNLRYVFNHANKINNILERYSYGMPKRFNTNFNIQEIDNRQNIAFIFEDSGIHNQFTTINIAGDDCLTFIETYLEYFEIIQKVIVIGNKYEGQTWESLKNTFALIGCYRNYDSFTDSYAIEANEQQAFEATTNKFKTETTKALMSGEPPVFEFVKKVITYRYNQYYEEVGRNGAKNKIELDALFININHLLKDDPLNLKITIDRPNRNNPANHTINFKSLKTGEVINVNELSAGQKGVLHFIFSIYGYDLKHGLMIIDEPELHLHPQIQEQYLKVISDSIAKFNIQFILVTHSPIFINSSNIGNVFRFYLNNGFTKVINPGITDEEKDLIKILTHANSSKIFFALKVVLVEGESDEYFYKSFLEAYKENKKIESNIEIINIKGKGEYKIWKEFLEKYKINTYFIGDWDNVVDFKIIPQDTLNSFIRKYNNKIYPIIAKSLSDKNSNDKVLLITKLDAYIQNPSQGNLSDLKDLHEYLTKRHIPYEDLIVFINTLKTKNYFKRKIYKLYAANIFLLQRGELESYINIEKGLANVIKFSKEKLNAWVATENSDYKELENIFSIISK